MGLLLRPDIRLLRGEEEILLSLLPLGRVRLAFIYIMCVCSINLYKVIVYIAAVPPTTKDSDSEDCGEFLGPTWTKK